VLFNRFCIVTCAHRQPASTLTFRWTYRRLSARRPSSRATTRSCQLHAGHLGQLADSARSGRDDNAADECCTCSERAAGRMQAVLVRTYAQARHASFAPVCSIPVAVNEHCVERVSEHPGCILFRLSTVPVHTCAPRWSPATTQKIKRTKIEIVSPQPRA
jgi:hypothetical protein